MPEWLTNNWIGFLVGVASYYIVPPIAAGFAEAHYERFYDFERATKVAATTGLIAGMLIVTIMSKLGL